MVCTKTDNFLFYGFSDSEWTGLADDQRSTMDCVFSSGSRVDLGSSNKRPPIALSSLEAKYMAVITVAYQATWLRRILEDIKHESSNERNNNLL